MPRKRFPTEARPSARRAASVVGSGMSWVVMSSACAPALVSEHTTKGRMSVCVWAIHSRSDCDTSEIDGARKSTFSWPPFSAHSCSASFREVKVLPVPQAEIHLPRAEVVKPSVILSIAVFWCGRSPYFTAFLSWNSRRPGAACIQSIGDSAISASPIR